MQRYRRLTIEELEAVRPEFVKFLASEGIAADDWERKAPGRLDRRRGLPR